jgi:PadR family transcriptional regulator, regulatory protein AphA
MENVILGLLTIQSLTLYGLAQAFKQGISMFYSASYGSLQVAVRHLLSKGMVVYEEKVKRGRNQKVYSITPAGRQAFLEWMLDEIPASKLEVTALSKVYFLGLIESRAQRKQIVQGILGKVEQVQGELDAANDSLSQMAIPRAYQEVFRYQIKTLDYGRQAHIFARKWFKALLGEI